MALKVHQHPKSPLKLVLDAHDAEHPSMVYLEVLDKTFSATWDVAVEKCVLQYFEHEYWELSTLQVDWLLTLENEVVETETKSDRNEKG